MGTEGGAGECKNRAASNRILPRKLKNWTACMFSPVILCLQVLKGGDFHMLELV